MFNGRKPQDLELKKREQTMPLVQTGGVTLHYREAGSGQDVMVHTSRRLVVGDDEVSSLRIGQRVSEALVAIVQGISTQPAWVIAKGGITSSDVATKGLEIKRADVLGQAIPGIPVWRAGGGSRWPGQVYVVFPGNVGGPEALAEMVGVLCGT